MLDVLVVEDDRGIAESLVELLTDEGHLVRWARDGVEGLVLLAERRPDLILLDLMMPRMDGFEFRAIQKDRPGCGTVPVIVISAHARAHEIEASTFLSKPFAVTDLLDAVDRHAGAH